MIIVTMAYGKNLVRGNVLVWYHYAKFSSIKFIVLQKQDGANLPNY